MSGLKVAVTGAAGLVGSHLIEYLGERGYQLTAIVRSSKKEGEVLEVFRRFNVNVIEADVNDCEKLKDAFVGQDIVVHTAAIVDPYGSRDLIFKTNVGGTENALLQAMQASVQQFVFVSSLSVITGRGDQFDTAEDAPYQPTGEAYADSKIKAEQAVLSSIGKSSMKITVVRPGFIYGNREKTWMPRLIQSIKTGKAMLIDGGTKETNVVYVDNLSKAIESTFQNAKANGQVYNLTDGPAISKKMLFDSLSDGLNLPRVEKRVPGFLAKGFCELVSSIAPMLSPEKQVGLARYSRAGFRLAGQNQGFSIKKAERDLGYGERLSFQVGMAATLEKLREKLERKPSEMEKAVARN